MQWKTGFLWEEKIVCDHVIKTVSEVQAKKGTENIFVP